MGEARGRRGRRRAARGDKRLREEILAATDRLLFEAGDEGKVSVAGICRSVGCTPPSLYHHFVDKEALLREVCSHRFEQFAAELDAAAAQTEDPLERVRHKGRAYLGWAIEHPEHYRVLFMSRPGGPAGGEMSDEPGAGLRELISDVQECMAAGRFASDDPVTVAVVLWSAVHGVASLYISNAGIPRSMAEQWLEKATSALYRGLAPGKEG